MQYFDIEIEFLRKLRMQFLPITPVSAMTSRQREVGRTFRFRYVGPFYRLLFTRVVSSGQRERNFCAVYCVLFTRFTTSGQRVVGVVYVFFLTRFMKIGQRELGR